MHIHFFTVVILAVISSLLAVALDRRFVRDRRLTQSAPPTQQQQSPEV